MKKFSFLALAAAGMLLAACSSDKDVAGEAPSVSANGDGFVGISISIPSADGTRANDDLTNGKADEFAVKNAYLYLFVGSDASNAKFVKRYSITDSFDPDDQEASNTPTPQDGVTLPNGTAITSTAVAVCKVDNLELENGQHLFAFVAVNAQGALANAPAKNTPFSTFGVEPLDEEDRGGDLEGNIGALGLLMTNSPISDNPRGSTATATVNHSTLVQLNDDAIKTSREAAEQAPAGCIYVERAAAKIDLTVPDGTSTGLTTANSVKYNPSGIKWEVQNYNSSFYLSRHVSTTYLGYSSSLVSPAFYRFAEATAVDPTMATKNYRIPWAEDANYTSTKPENVPTTDVIGKQVSFTKTTSDVAYLAENTVDENSLKQEFTTRIVLAVPFNGGTSFYTSSLGGADEIFSVDNMIAKVKQYITSTHSKTATDVTFTNADDGTATVSSVTLSDGDATDVSTIIADLTAHVQFSYYKDGMAYYKVLVKHFGDVETPLRPASEITGSDYDDVYPTTNRAQNYLGRYSIVRNNWYRITLDGIKHIGKPSVPEIPEDTPDDEIDAYLKVRINILSWGVRTQHVTL